MTVTSTHFEQVEIPRHKEWGGPLVIPEGATVPSGPNSCERCGRSCTFTGKRRNAERTAFQKYGDCPCEYYKRTTRFIEVLDSTWNLQEWDKRNVVWGMGQREDLQMLAAATRPNDDPNVTQHDKDTLNAIARDAAHYAKSSAQASKGTSAHKFTEWLDRGEPLGNVPSRLVGDLKAYEDATKNIEWVEIECFRVHDTYKVAGTCDRIGWYNGVLTMFDLKTGNMEWGAGTKAMQLAMYARMRKYSVAQDIRVPDVGTIDLHHAYIIHLPTGQGRCEFVPFDIQSAWAGVQLCKQVWDWRKDCEKLKLDKVRTYGTPWVNKIEHAKTIEECRDLWRRLCAEATPQTGLKEKLKLKVQELQHAAYAQPL